MKKNIVLSAVLLAFLAGKAEAQTIESTVEERLQSFFKTYKTEHASIGECSLDSVEIDFKKKKLTVFAGDRFSWQPFRPETVDAIYRDLKQTLPGPVTYFDVSILAGGREISTLVPNIYREGKKDKERLSLKQEYKGKPWVTRASRPNEISRGLNNKHIALWQSHGKYYINKLDKWGWQRPRLFCTSEDQLTQSFILPYLIPMLENAGANVFTPRERDTQLNEVIVDNDGNQQCPNALYVEEESRKAKWSATSMAGFAQLKTSYQDNENPFTDGTARFAPTEKKAGRAFAEWVPEIPEAGEYAVYVSYQTLPNSISDAKYLVYHNGGVTEFKVNQQMGGGTWVYLGTFSFSKGRNDYGMVVLSNESKQKGVVCADAVRFGGGMGNMPRGGKLSGLPRYLEAARYTAQWSGIPYNIYSVFEGKNDYSDDIAVRGATVNYLAGGSIFNPKEEGLKVPFEMSMALHTDAGVNAGDSIIGCLSVYTTNFNNGKLNNGTDRITSRDLADLMLTELKRDIPANFDIDFTRRGMWDRNYGETRRPAVPSTIVELLSHQNFGDMRLAHDPNFKFTVGRSLYKAILRYVTTQHGDKYVVQPLPVDHFAISFGAKKNTVELTWKPVNDPLEPTAKAEQYIVYTRIGRSGWDNGTLVEGTSYTATIQPGFIHSYKVTAVNRGGESFPSEILCAYKAKNESGKVLIVNGFDRISGPAVIDTPTEAGFDMERDPGVPYQQDISYCGRQTNFDRSQIGKNLGVSTDEYEGMAIAGNTFDYAYTHGKALQQMGGISFTACSDEVVEENLIDLQSYQAIDYILGMEKDDKSYNPAGKSNYKTFTPAMQNALTNYTRTGGHLLVSGAFVGSDMQTDAERNFTESVLKYRYDASLMTSDTLNVTIQGLGDSYTLPRRPNPVQYAVSIPDCILPAGTAFTSLTYAEGTGAAIAYKGNDYRTFVLAFPLEAVQSETGRTRIMASAIQFLLKD
ncbi:MAG: xanthan lyase [Bacteroides sp.]|nr:xanthan lyase [Bacteroides sp.]